MLMVLAHFLLEDDSTNSLARQRVFRDRLNPLDAYNEIEFRARSKVTKCMFFLLEEKLLNFLSRSTIRSHPIAPSTQLAAALQLLCTGSFRTVVASSHGISQASVSRCIRTVTDALCYCAK